MSEGGTSALARNEFEVTSALAAEGPVVSVGGEVDLLSVPYLRSAVAVLIDQGHRQVVLDLGRTTFMGAEGLAIVADAAERLAARAGRLVLRSPSPRLREIIDIVGLSPAVDIENPKSAAPTKLAPPSPAVTAHGGENPTLTGYLRRITALPAGQDVVDAALALVVAMTAATVKGADGVSVSLKRHGELKTVAASDEAVASLDNDQYRAGEGPCLQASTLGQTAHSRSLEDEIRWPIFRLKAAEQGVKAILSTPLLDGGDPAGALNIYSRTAGAFDMEGQDLASTFATRTSMVLDHAGAVVTELDLDERLTVAMRNRQVIAQAQGVVMARHELTAEAAYATLRRLAVHQGRPLEKVAAETVASTQPSGRTEELQSDG